MANEYRVSHHTAEVLVSGNTPSARSTQHVAEVLISGNPPQTRVSCIAVEVLRSIADDSGRRRLFYTFN